MFCDKNGKRIGNEEVPVAISPPSDIVLDVARAVEPAALEAARRKLSSIAGTRAGDAFSTTMDASGMRGEPLSRIATGSARPESYVQFEAMVLQNFVQQMLPSDAENVYGTGIAGEMWKGFLAQELGMQMARVGGIGISDRILGDYYEAGDEKVPVAGVEADTEDKLAGEAKSLLSTALIQEIQRTIVGSVTDAAAAASGVTSDQ